MRWFLRLIASDSRRVERRINSPTSSFQSPVKPEVGASLTGWHDMEKVCPFHCHKKGHVKADCYALQKRNKQVKGVHLILGNGLAGGRVGPNVPPLLVVNPVCAASDGPDECERTFPDVSPACVVTHAGARAGGDHDKINVMKAPCMNLPDLPLSVSCAELVAEQQSYPALWQK